MYFAVSNYSYGSIDRFAASPGPINEQRVVGVHYTLENMSLFNSSFVVIMTSFTRNYTISYIKLRVDIFK